VKQFPPLVCRFAWLALALLLAGCAASAPAPGRDEIVETATGRRIERAELLAAIRDSDFVLLGEQHDNPLHHARRGELIEALAAPGAPVTVVAEQLPRGVPVVFGADLLASLNAAGFDAQGWSWPLHEPLFAAVARAGLPLTGGNLPRDRVRRVAREGTAALPGEIAALLERAPLDAAGAAALDAELVEGHCGQALGAMLARLREAQRARDASLALALEASGGKPAVLIAGNGHVRLDHGVPTLLAALRPAARIVSVGFGEPGEVARAGTYRYLWITAAPAQRDDPCAGFTLPAR